MLRLATGERVELLREEFSLLDGNGNIRAVAHNFPVTLAWATTIHKAQGASIDRLMVSMNGLWESGHAYVALSRARSEEGLFIEQWDAKSIMVDPAVQTFYAAVRSSWDTIAAKLPETPARAVETDVPPPGLAAPSTRSTHERRTPREKPMANHLRTAALLLERKSLADIAAKLGWTSGTIAGHVERFVEEGRCPDIEYLRPAPGPFEEMKRLFVEHGTEKLRPVFD